MTALASAWSWISLAWSALSPLGLGLGAAGAGILAAALVAPIVVPRAIVRLAIAAGAALLGAGLLYQTAYARGVLDEAVRVERRATAAEEKRAAAALRLVESLAKQAVVDREAIAAAERRFQELTDVLASHPDRDRTCVDRGLARRLRAL